MSKRDCKVIEHTHSSKACINPRNVVTYTMTNEISGTQKLRWRIVLVHFLNAF